MSTDAAVERSRPWLVCGGLLIGACTSHRITVDPVEFKPIHLTMDVNIHVQKELDDFFDFEKELDPSAEGGQVEAKVPEGN